MMQFYSDNLLLVAVTRGNVENLTSGKPLVIPIVAHKNPREIVVMFGETKPAIIAELERAGVDIPAVWKAEAEADPT